MKTSACHLITSIALFLCAPVFAQTSITPASHEVGAEVVPYQVLVNSTVAWTATKTASWVTLSPTSGSLDGNILVTAAANTTGADRTATITVNGATHTLTQRAASAALQELWSFGSDSSGQLGDNALGQRTRAVQVAGGVKAVSAGAGYSLILKTDGSLWATGYNNGGQLGDGTTTNRSTPVQILSSGVQAVSAGGNGQSLILKTNGSLWAVGSNGNGQLGDGTTIDRHSPVQILPSGVQAITAGYDFSLFIKTDGSLWAMGDNYFGQLGDGTTIQRNSPVQILPSGVQAVATGACHSLILKTDGSLWATGANWSGQLGDGTNIQRNSPVEILSSGVQAVAAGGWGFSMFLKTDGSVWAMGGNGNGEFGNGTTVSSNVPVEALSGGVQAISAGFSSSMILKTDGSLWAAGFNGGGQIGDGTTTDRPSPVQILSSGVQAISAGGWHSLILKTDGTLWATGLNNCGQLGDGRTLQHASPIQALSGGVQALSAGSSHSLILNKDGSLWAMGWNEYGELGDGTMIESSTPEQILADGVQAVAAGSSHSLILKTDGSLWAMGANGNGQLGDGTTTQQNAPEQILSDGVQAVAAGNLHSLIVKTDGSLWAMGDNTYGQLGDGTTTQRNRPVSVLSGGVRAVATRANSSLIVKEDGSLWAMGDNTYGQLGDGTTTQRTNPVLILSDGVQAVVAGAQHSLILKTNGSLWAMGDNTYGQLGDGTTTQRNSPIQILPGDVQAIAAGDLHSLILKTDGSLWAMGANWFGQLGDGTTTGHITPERIAVNVQKIAAGGGHSLILTRGDNAVDAPQITAEPASQAANPGNTVTFSVTATGTPVPTYQWYFNGQALAGATAATLTISNVQLANVGYYDVVVTNTHGSVPSAEVSLNLTSIPIATTVGVREMSISAAFDGTNYLVGVQGDAIAHDHITAQLVSQTGALVGPRISAGSGVFGGVESVVFDGTNYAMVWQSAGDQGQPLVGMFVSPSGVAGEPGMFPRSASDSTNQDISGAAFDGTNNLVVYVDGESTPYRLCGRFVSPTGTFGDEFVLATNAAQSLQSVAWNGSTYLVAWPAHIGGNQNIVQGRTVSKTGVMSDVFTIDGTISVDQNPLSVATDGTNFLVVWNYDASVDQQGNAIWELRGRVVTPTGGFLGPQFTVADTSTRPSFPETAFDGTNYLVAWTAQPNSWNRDIVGRYFASDGTPQGAAFDIVVGKGNSFLPVVAAGGGKCLVAWNDGYVSDSDTIDGDVRGLLLSSPPKFTTQPASQTVPAGSAATFTAAASGTPSYLWQVSIDGGSTWNNLTNTAPYSGTTTGTLTITGATMSLNSHKYRCVATNSTGGGIPSNAATLTVSKAVSVITWAAPAAITYPTALSSTQLNATASVPGAFVYSPAAGTVLSGGAHTLHATFTPTDTASYTTVTASVVLTVNKAVAVITWPTPAAITYGTALSATQLNATASVPGTLVYSPAAGTVVGAGAHTLHVTFTPTDTANYATVAVTKTLTVNKAVPVLTWAAPAPISYGTALSATQLDATANVPGAFTYSQPVGAVLRGGGHTLHAFFTPTDTTDYTSTSTTQVVTISKAVPAITWPAPAPITYGTALSATQLNAKASVPGVLTYVPAAGTVLKGGTQTLKVYFAPTDSTDYAGTTATTTLIVNKAVPVITWAAPASITYGTALSATQLNARCSVTGTFVYSPAAGTVLSVGAHTLHVTFTPNNTTNYAVATASQTLTVASASGQAFLQKLFKLVNGRPIDSTTLSNYLAAMAGGLTRAQVYGEMISSPEYGARQIDPVIRLHYAALGRIPDYATLQKWSGALQAGTLTLTGVADQLSSSAEFVQRYGSLDNTQFVQQLSRDLPGCKADTAGLAGRVAKLDSGVSRGAMLLSLAESDEFKTDISDQLEIARLYCLLQQRMPTAAESLVWQDFLLGDGQADDAATIQQETDLSTDYQTTLTDQFRATFLDDPGFAD